MKKILILFAHPAFPRSKINAALRGAVDGLPGVGDRQAMGLRGPGHAGAHAIAAWRRDGVVRTELNCGTYQDTDGKRSKA